MKLHGRITVFGEYLLKNNLSYCLCIKSGLFLSNNKEDSNFVHPFYDQSKDTTLSFLAGKIKGLKPNPIYGNLPLGYGLSSSTVLSLLHLNSPENRRLVVEVDKSTQGFSPSGLDFTSITQQENGLFGFGNWRSMQGLNLIYSVIIIPKEGKRTLTDAKQRIASQMAYQIKLCDSLNVKLGRDGLLDFNLFFEYCKLLLSLGIYSETATHIIKDLIRRGVAIKCIGGLYDKALLIIHPDSNSKSRWDDYILNNYSVGKIQE